MTAEWLQDALEVTWLLRACRRRLRLPARGSSCDCASCVDRNGFAVTVRAETQMERERRCGVRRRYSIRHLLAMLHRVIC